MAGQSQGPTEFKLYTGYPRRILSDDSKSLGDLGLAPNGILHLVRSNFIVNSNHLLLWTMKYLISFQNKSHWLSFKVWSKGEKYPN